MSSEKKPQPVAGIQRYDVDAGRLADGYWEDILQVSAEGPWVRYSDHEATLATLSARVAQLEAALGDLEGSCEKLAAGRPFAAYDAMMQAGQSDDLLALDVARRRARALLSDGGRG